MSSTYSKIYIQVVFAVKDRISLIHSDWEESLYRYITGIVQNKEQKMLAINGMPDHLHLPRVERERAEIDRQDRELPGSGRAVRRTV